jgi:hypothetical protein
MPHLTEVAFALADKVKTSLISAVRYVLLHNIIEEHFWNILTAVGFHRDNHQRIPTRVNRK